MQELIEFSIEKKILQINNKKKNLMHNRCNEEKKKNRNDTISSHEEVLVSMLL